MRLPFANTTIKVQNPGATMPLILPLHLLCNTDDEPLYENVRQNSRLKRTWIRQVAPHDGIAVICGSGPSLADHLDEIKAKAEAGCKIFALNGAARYLDDHHILADYQVIVDAREQTASLIGPARDHLFASQVHPECFRRAPHALLWHQQVGNLDSLLPEKHQGSYVIIGGAASVGNSAACLVYAMGFRHLHLYGYDSCNRDGKTHAFDQPMNLGEPEAIVEFNGKQYTASLTMKLQAERFMLTSKALADAGVTIAVHGDGLLPDMFRAPKEVLDEAEKYERMWRLGSYREHSPGEDRADLFMLVAQPDGRVIDFGCGTGRGALALAQYGLKVICVDFAENCRDDAAMFLEFHKHDLTKPLSIKAPFGYCTDVMEHIPPDDVAVVISNIVNAAEKVFFQISTVPDNYGGIIRQELHLTVKPLEWWAELFVSLDCEILWQQRETDAAVFYVRKRKAQ